MFQDRKEYRKSFNSSGQLYVSGELLDFVSYDVSVKGILIEIIPGNLLAEIGDFETLIKENNAAEIYVKDLMLTGEVDIAWVKSENEKIMLGLEFRDVMYNAEKLWRKRSFFRARKQNSGYLIVDDKKIDFKGLDVSADGMAIQVNQVDESIKPGHIVKLMLNGLDVKGLGKIVWVKSYTDEMTVLGLRYLTIE